MAATAAAAVAWALVARFMSICGSLTVENSTFENNGAVGGNGGLAAASPRL